MWPYRIIGPARVAGVSFLVLGWQWNRVDWLCGGAAMLALAAVLYVQKRRLSRRTDE